MSEGPTRARLGRILLIIAFVLAFVVIGIAVWRNSQKITHPDQSPHANLGELLQANNRGIGLMEQFQYDKAIEAFEEAAKHAPDWTPAKINLGIALLNTQAPDKLDRALGLFKEVLDKEPDEPHAARPDGDAKRHLTRSGCCASRHQVGDVGAGYEENHRHKDCDGSQGAAVFLLHA